MNKISAILLELIKSAVWNVSADKQVLSRCDLRQLMREAEKQTVVGLVAEGLDVNGFFDHCSFEEKMQWVGILSQIEGENEKHQRVMVKTLKCLQDKNIPVVFMKGLVAGNRYPNPLRRQCGDIDFVVAQSDFERTLEALDTIGKVNRELHHEHHGMAYVDGVILEPHYKVHNFQNPKVDQAMLEIFSEVFPNKLELERIGDCDIPVFPPESECVMLVGHMVNHVYAEGLGLRQVLDFMLFLKEKYHTLDNILCLQYLERMEMVRAFHVFTRISEKYLGMPTNIVHQSYTDKELKAADKMMENIMGVGNFGRGKRNVGHHFLLRPIKSYLWVLRRCWTLRDVCPAEARWWPVAKFRRFWWKKAQKKAS